MEFKDIFYLFINSSSFIDINFAFNYRFEEVKKKL